MAGTTSHRPDAYTIVAAVERQHLTVVQLVERELSQELQALPLHTGERHAIALAQRESADLLLLDDWKARQEARRLDLKVKGTLAVIVAAHRGELLSLADVDIIFRQIMAHPDIWISESLCREVWQSLQQS